VKSQTKIQTLKIATVTLTGFLALGLAACNGKNPIDRSNDPTKDFTEFKQDSETYQNLKTEKVDNGQTSCGKIYDIDVKEASARNLVFVEGEEKSYIVKLRSYTGAPFQFGIASAPDASVSLSKVDNQGNWKISWKPSIGTVDRRNGYSQKILSLAYRPDLNAASPNLKGCLIEAFVEDFTMTVTANSTQPTISISGLDEKTVYNSSKGAISFKVSVSDPGANSNFTPILSFIDDSRTSSEVTTMNINARCARAVATGANSWDFSCVADFREIHSRTDLSGKLVQGQVTVISSGVYEDTVELKKTIKISVNNKTEVPMPPLSQSKVEATPATKQKVEDDQTPTTGIAPIPQFRSETGAQ